MKLRNARNMQYTLAVVILLVFLPFAVCYLVFGILYFCCDRMMLYAQRMNYFFGRYLFLHSDEVKDGSIQNQDVLKYDTASMAYRRMNFVNTKTSKEE